MPDTPPPESNRKSRVLEIAERIDYAKKEEAAAERKLAEMKRVYEETRASTLASLTRTREHLSDLSKELSVEAEALRAGSPTPPTPEPGTRTPRAKPMARAEAERRFGPVVWDVEGHNVLRRELVRFVTNRAATTFSDFERYYVGAGGTAGSAHTVWGSLLAYGRTKGWVHGEGGRKSEFYIAYPTNGLDLATATPAEKDRLLDEARAAQEASRRRPGPPAWIPERGLESLEVRRFGLTLRRFPHHRPNRGRTL